MLLLAFHQKLKLKREKTQLTLSMARRTSRIDRLKKAVQNKQKYYASKIKDAENYINLQQKQLQAQLNMNNCGYINPFNGFQGQGGIFMQCMQQWCQNGFNNQQTVNGKTIGCNIDANIFNEMYTIYQQNGGMYGFKDKDGNWLKPEYEQNYTGFNQAINQAGYAQQQKTWQDNQYMSEVTQKSSIWLEAYKSQIEAEEEEVVGALSYEEEMEEMDKEYEETRLAEINAELESYDQLLKEEIKSSTPHFGLG